jgi:hypothetical protein
VFRLLLCAIATIFRPRALLIAENLCLRQQLLVLQPPTLLVSPWATPKTPDRIFAPYSVKFSWRFREFSPLAERSR